MNTSLLDVYKPKAVVFVGLSHATKASRIFGLKRVSTLPVDGIRVIERFEDKDRPWFFTKHWTGSRGFTKAQREAIRAYLSSNLG